MDITSHELILLLAEQGWAWQPWIPRSQRRRGVAIADGFAPGDAKIWYSTLEPSAHYLQCLLRADELHAQGLLYVPHGRQEQKYKKTY